MELRVAILRADDVRPELADTYGEYPEMFEVLLSEANKQRPLKDQVVLKAMAYRTNQGVFPANIDEYDAYIITGSKSGIYDDEDWIKALKQYVLRLNAKNKKLIGICFGHQIIAEALGGHAGKASCGWEIGVKQAVMFKGGDPRFSGVSEFCLTYSHQDQVLEKAPGSQVLAATPNCPIAMTSLGSHILTFQGHPEFVKSYARALFELRESSYPAEVYSECKASLSIDTQHLEVAHWMIDFMRA
jgi:GMP synthase-like glutamine amidotransferase